MCTNIRRIQNPYTKRFVYPKCGHCPSCLQEKAAKMADRLRMVEGYKRYFLTLTYKNEFLPYVLRSDLLDQSNIGIVPVYRDGSCRKVRAKGFYSDGSQKQRNKFVYQPDTVIDYCRFTPKFRSHADEFDYVKMRRNDDVYDPRIEVSKLKHPTRHRNRDAVSIIYYKDIQLFVKRFKQYVERRLQKDCTNDTNRVFICSEYGETNHRAHFHILLDSKNLSLEDVKCALVSCWPYADFKQLRRYCEEACDISGYVASYVNCADSISELLSSSPFRPRHSFSQGLALDSHEFCASSVLEKVARGSLVYSAKRVKDGIAKDFDFPLPEYVLRRFFPKFKGIGSLSAAEIYNILSNIETRGRFPKFYQEYLRDDVVVRNQSFSRKGIFYKSRRVDDYKLIRSQLLNAYYRVFQEKSRQSFPYPCGYSWNDYIFDYIDVLRLRGRDILRSFYMNKKNIPQVQCYDNILDLVSGDVHNDTLWSMIDLDDPDCKIVTDPNEFEHNKASTAKNEYYFGLYSKYRKVTNQMMVSQGHDV